jgi:protein-tyrosine phosphatase
MALAPLLLLLLPLAAALADSTTQSPEIKGAMNFRDIGGIPTSDGHVVRRGLLFRSGELNTLTESDLQTLAALKIRYIFDTRTNPERAAAPTNWTKDAPTIVPLSVGFNADDNPAASMKLIFSKGFDPASVTAGMQAATAKIAIDGAPAIGQILHSLAQGQEPAIIHCTAGKDRTGVIVAILLGILGVDKDRVYDDYLRSNASVPSQIARLKSASTGLPSALAMMPPESVKVLMGVDASFLDAAVAAMQDKYGSLGDYVVNGLKLTQDDVEALRARFLEPAR